MLHSELLIHQYVWGMQHAGFMKEIVIETKHKSEQHGFPLIPVWEWT
jgi:hypothetical protein